MLGERGRFGIADSRYSYRLRWVSSDTPSNSHPISLVERIIRPFINDISGVAIALTEMLADTVASVSLLDDADSEGDRVTTASVTGTVVGIDLRKTRIRDDNGDLVVVANRDVEKKWIQEAADGDDRDSPISGGE